MQTDKLDGMEARYITLEDQLSDPSVIADQNKWRALSKEHAELGEIVSKYREYKEADKACKDALDILEDKSQGAAQVRLPDLCDIDSVIGDHAA